MIKVYLVFNHIFDGGIGWFSLYLRLMSDGLGGFATTCSDIWRKQSTTCKRRSFWESDKKWDTAHTFIFGCSYYVEGPLAVHGQSLSHRGGMCQEGVPGRTLLAQFQPDAQPRPVQTISVSVFPKLLHFLNFPKTSQFSQNSSLSTATFVSRKKFQLTRRSLIVSTRVAATVAIFLNLFKWKSSWTFFYSVCIRF